MSLYDYLPEHLKSNKIEDILNNCDGVVGQLQLDLQIAKSELFIDSATEKGIEYWERYLDINNMTTIPLQQRKNNILSKINISRSCTLDAIETLANSWNCGKVEVTENYSSYLINIAFVDLGIPSNLMLFEKNLRELLPAHLTWNLEFRFNKWEAVKPHMWSCFLGKTWEQLRATEIEDHEHTSEKFTLGNSLLGFGKLQ